MPQSKRKKSETKLLLIITIKKPTSLTGKHPNSLGTVGKMIFSTPTCDRTHYTLVSKVPIRPLLFSDFS